MASAAFETGWVRANGPRSPLRMNAKSLRSSPPRTISVSIQEKYATPTSTPVCLTSIRRAFANASSPALAAE